MAQRTQPCPVLAPAPVPRPAANTHDIRYPAVSDWLSKVESDGSRKGNGFVSYISAFEAAKIQTIDEIPFDPSEMTLSDFREGLGNMAIGDARAILKYAKEDIDGYRSGNPRYPDLVH